MRELRVVVDRIEGDLAALEVDGHLVDWPVSALPEGAVEGSVLAITLTVAPCDPTDAEARLDRLRARGPAGDDIDL